VFDSKCPHILSVLICFLFDTIVHLFLGIPVNQQHLLQGEKILSDNTTIASNNINDGATLRLVLSLQGGPIGTSRRMLPLDNETIRQLVNLNK